MVDRLSVLLDERPNRLAGIVEPSRDFLPEFIFSDKSVEDWLPAEQAEVAKNILDTFDKPEDERARISNSVLLSDMFDIPLDMTMTMQPEIMKEVFGEELKSIKDEFLKQPYKGGFFSKIAESWRRGSTEINSDIADYETLFEGRGNWEETTKIRNKLAAKETLTPIEGSFLAELVYGSARILPGMAKGYWSAIDEAFVGMAAGASMALAAGQVPPLTLAPEEIGTVPAGGLIGLTAGFGAGAALFWYKQGAGGMARNMIEKGYDPEVSKNVAAIAAVPYAIIEFLQVSRLTPGLRQTIAKQLQTSTLRVFTNAAKRYGGVLTEEVFEEVLQEIIQIAAEDISGLLSEAGIEVDAKWFSERATRVWQTLKESTKGMALLPLPGAAIDVHTGMRTVKDVSVAEKARFAARMKADIDKGLYAREARMQEEREKAEAAPVAKPPAKAAIVPEAATAELTEAIKKHPGTLTVAVKLKNGEIIADSQVGNHGELMEKHQLSPDDIKDGGFTVGGKYISSITDAKPPAPPKAPEAKVEKRLDKAFTENDLQEVKKIERELEKAPYTEEDDELLGRIIPLRLEMEMRNLDKLSTERLYEIAADEGIFEVIKSRKKLISRIREVHKPAQPPTAKEAGEAEMAVTELGISERDRNTRIKAVEEQIRQHELYQDAVDVEAEKTSAIGTGFYYIPPSHKSEVYDIIGYPKKGRETALQKMFTFELNTGAQSYDQTVQEALAKYTPEGEDTSLSMDVTEFVQRVKEAHEAKKGRKTFNERALAAALETGEPTLQLLNDIRYGLQAGKTIEEINANTIEFADFYGLTKEDVSDYIIPEYTDEQRAKEIEAARPKDEKLETVARERQAAEREERRKRSAEMKRIQEEEKLRKMAEQARLQKRGELEKQATQIAIEKGLLSKRKKRHPNFNRFAKAVTGVTQMGKMSDEQLSHFTDMLEALVTDRKGIAKIPTTKHLITGDFAAKIDELQEIGAVEHVRPAWRVFQKIGLYHEVFEPAFEAEIASYEELRDFRNSFAELKKEVGSGKAVSQKIFRALDKPGSVKLTAKEQKVATFAKRHFDDWADRFKLPLDKRRTNYVTHIFEKEIRRDLEDRYGPKLDPDLARALEFITPKTIFNPYLEKRLGKKLGLKEDIWAALEAYEAKALKKFYYEPLIRRLRAYQKFLPPNSARYLRDFITRITARPLVIDREINQSLREVAEQLEGLPLGGEFAKYLKSGNPAGLLAYNMTGIYYEAWLGGRPASAIKNLSQHGLILAETGPVAFGRALSTTGTARAELLKHSKVLRSRKLGYLPGVDQTFINGLESKRRQVTMAMFRLADRTNVSNAFIAGYYEGKANGLSDEWAYKRADEVAMKTQWLYSKLAGPQWTQSSVGRVLGTLTTWPENWAELMNDWIKAKPSLVYQDYAKETGQKIGATNWVARRKALWTYLALVSLGMLIHKKTKFKALYYTGWTSISSLADIARGQLAGLEIPAIISDLTAGILLGDKKRIKRAWNKIKGFVVITRELHDILTGEKDWINLFVYMETEKKKKKPTSTIKRKP